MKTTPLVLRISLIFLFALIAICAAIYWSMLDERVAIEKLMASANESAQQGLHDELEKMEHWLFILLSIVGVLLFSMWASVLRFVLPLEKNIKALLWEKEQIMATMSHEIKTPLAKAKLALEFVEEGKHKASIKKALSDIDALSALMLVNAEISAKNAQSSMFLASAALTGAVSMLTSQDVVSIEIKSDFEIKADKGEFVLAIKNLLENGIKHSDDGKVAVVVRQNAIVVSNGASNCPIDMQKLATPFFRQGATSGHGLGLYITQKIAHKWGFRLLFELANGRFVATLVF